MISLSKRKANLKNLQEYKAINLIKNKYKITKASMFLMVFRIFCKIRNKIVVRCLRIL